MHCMIGKYRIYQHKIFKHTFQSYFQTDMKIFVIYFKDIYFKDFNIAKEEYNTFHKNLKFSNVSLKEFYLNVFAVGSLVRVVFGLC